MDPICAIPSSTSMSCMSQTILAAHISNSILYPIQWFNTRSPPSLLPLVFIQSLIFTKPRVGMMGTFCSHHLPLRTLLPKLVFSLKNPIDFPFLVLITKLLLILLNLFKIFLQRKQRTEMGFVFHPISTKYWFLKHYFLFCFPFYKRLAYGTYTISCFFLGFLKLRKLHLTW